MKHRVTSHQGGNDVPKVFRYFYLSDLLAVVGASISYIAIYWTSAERLTAFQLALLIGAVFLTRFVVATFSGPLIDRVDPVRLLKGTVAVRTGLLVLTAIGLQLFSGSTGLLIALLIAQTVLQTIGGNTAFKVVVRLVEADRLPVANAYLSTLDRIGTLSGLLIGGVLIASFSIETILLMEAVLHGAAWLLLLSIKPAAPGGEGKQNRYIDALTEGLTYLKQDRQLMQILGFAVIANWMITPANTLLAPFAKDVVAGGAKTFSVLELALVIGGILMSLLYARFAKQVAHSRLFRLSVLLQGLFIIILSWTDTVSLAFTALFLLGAALSLFGIPFSTLLQQTTPDLLLGRVRSAMVAVSTLCSAVCYVLSGYMTTFLSIEHVFLFFGGSGLVGAVFLMLTSRHAASNISQDKAG
nr:MFS transporter [Exiguobacterium sp. s133]